MKKLAGRIEIDLSSDAKVEPFRADTQCESCLAETLLLQILWKWQALQDVKYIES